MAITERLYQFDTKGTLASTDIIFCGNSADTFNEVQTTVDGLLGAYSNLISQAQGLAITQASIAFNTTNGVIGTTTNNNATAGSVGELKNTIVLIGAAVPITTATDTNICSLVLGPGDWDVWGEFWTAPAASTTTSQIGVCLNTTITTVVSIPAVGTSSSNFNAALGATVAAQLPLAQCRISVATATTTTVYLNANVTFATSTMGGYGKIMARRRR